MARRLRPTSRLRSKEVTITRREALLRIGLAGLAGVAGGALGRVVPDAISGLRFDESQQDRTNALGTVNGLHTALRRFEQRNGLPHHSVDLYVNHAPSLVTFRIPSANELGIPVHLAVQLEEDAQSAIIKMAPALRNNFESVRRHFPPGSFNQTFDRVQDQFDQMELARTTNRASGQNWGVGLAGLAALVAGFRNHPWVRNWSWKKSQNDSSNSGARSAKKTKLDVPAVTASDEPEPVVPSPEVSAHSDRDGGKTISVATAPAGVSSPPDRLSDLSENAQRAYQDFDVPTGFLRELEGRVKLLPREYRNWHVVHSFLTSRAITGVEPHEVGHLLESEESERLTKPQLLLAGKVSRKVKDVLPDAHRDMAVPLAAALVRVVKSKEALENIEDAGRLGRIIETHWASFHRLPSGSKWDSVREFANTLRPASKPESSQSVLISDLIDSTRADPQVCEDVARVLANLGRYAFVGNRRIKQQTLYDNLVGYPVTAVDSALRHLVTLGHVDRVEKAGFSKSSEPTYSIKVGSELQNRVTRRIYFRHP